MSNIRSLDEIQRDVARFARSRRSLPGFAEAAAFAAREIGGSSRLSPVEQLEIYREQFWLRHTSALLEDFPGVSGIIGQAAWERLVESYFEAVAPASFTLRDLGHGFPEFVAQAGWLERRELTADMARLEWAYVEAFDAADVPPLNPAIISSVPDEAWDSARLVLSPSLSLLSLSYPVVELRRSLVNGNHQEVVIPEREPALVAVCRPKFEIFVHPLEAPAFALLRKLGSLPLIAALEAAASESGVALEELAPRLGAWFAKWAEQGLVVGVETATA